MLSESQQDDVAEAALQLALTSTNYGSAFRKLRREFPDIDRQDLINQFDKVWDRGQRVQYWDTANAGQFISRDRLQCGDTGNIVFVTYRTSFIDEGGNLFEQYYHVRVPLMKRIGDTRDEAFNEMLIQLRDRYFPDWSYPNVRDRVLNADVVQVKCLTGGD